MVLRYSTVFMWDQLRGIVVLGHQPSATNQETSYRQISNIRRTKSQHLKDSRTVLRLSLPNPLKPVVKSRMKM